MLGQKKVKCNKPANHEYIEVYNRAIDDFMERIDDDICNDCSKCGNGCRLLELREIAEQLKVGQHYEC